MKVKTSSNMTVSPAPRGRIAPWVLLAVAWMVFASHAPVQGETPVAHEPWVYPQATAAMCLREDLKAITVPTRRSDAAVGLPAPIAHTFEKALFDAVVLEGDFLAVRVFGCEAKPTGHYLTIAPATPTRMDAVRILALPVENRASHVAEVTIPEGTQVFVGHVGGGHATQLFVRDPSVLRVQNISFLK